MSGAGPPRAGEPASLARLVARLLGEAALLCIVTASALACLARWAGPPCVARPSSRALPTAVAELCAHPAAPPRHWRYIVIHHSATEAGGAAAFDRYHRLVRGWKALGYHFVIGNGTQTGDGEIEASVRWKLQQPGSHAGVAEFNELGIGICLVGNFDEAQPTALQMRALECLVRHLMRRYAIPAGRVLGHRECPGAATDCPGRHFDMDAFRALLEGPPAGPAALAPCPGVR